jgi:Flp pilus assembly protein TadG
MKNLYNREGQTLIETALVLFLLLIILLGITEFARAWFTKNSHKNAARHGVRIAVVTDGIIDVNPVACPQPGDVVINAVCTSPGVRNDNRTTVSIDVVEKGAGVPADTGDTVQVNSVFNDSTFFIVGGSPWPWPKGLNTNVSASMRYE